MASTIYILELEHGKYYVGRSSLPSARIIDHFSGCGSEWTFIHRPLRIHKQIYNCSPFDEDKHTKEMMAQYGIENVRGGTYCQLDLPIGAIELLEREIRGATNACLRCGRSSHFIQDCYARVDVNGFPINSGGANNNRREYNNGGVSNNQSNTSVYIGNNRQEHINGGVFNNYGNNGVHNGSAYGDWNYIDDSDDDEDEEDIQEVGGCFRCGRASHYAAFCYARTDVYGRPLR